MIQEPAGEASAPLDRRAIRAAARETLGVRSLLPGQAEAVAAVTSGTGHARHPADRRRQERDLPARRRIDRRAHRRRVAAHRADAGPARVDHGARARRRHGELGVLGERARGGAGPGVITASDADQIVVAFERVGHRTLSTTVVEEEGLLVAAEPAGAVASGG